MVMAQTISTQVGPDAVAAPSTMTAEDEGDVVFHDIPPFPDDVPVAPLLRISLKKLIEKDPSELDRLWDASRQLGFFYIDLRGAIEERKRDSAHELSNGSANEPTINGEELIKDAERMHSLGPELFDSLSVEEKNKYDYKDNGSGSYYGYKGLHQGIIDAKGTRDQTEIWNVSKNDILGTSERRPNPDILQDESNRQLLRNFITQTHGIMTLVFKVLNEKLGLPPQTLQNLHRLEGAAGDQARWLYSPARPLDVMSMATGEHTDFGSLTILFNKLGGLQILPPNDTTWAYVRPLKGHCICNLGDAMVKFTAGTLRSNIHRVVNPPGEQRHSKRVSVVYFNRPEDDVILRVLNGSKLIDEERKKHPEYDEQDKKEVVTSREWTMRRSLGKRVGGNWEGTLGTEGDRLTKS